MSRKIELVAKELYGFSKEKAEELINAMAEAIKHYWRWCERQAIQRGHGYKGYAKEMYEREIAYLRTQKQQEAELKELAKIREAIKDRRLVVIHKRGLRWTVRYIENNRLQGLSLYHMKILCPYRLNYEDRTYTMNVYGTDRALEIILKYGYALGLKFNEIPQNQQVIV